MRRLDSGSEPFFGDFTVVFNSRLALHAAAWNLAALREKPLKLRSAKCVHVCMHVYMTVYHCILL